MSGHDETIEVQQAKAVAASGALLRALVFNHYDDAPDYLKSRYLPVPQNPYTLKAFKQFRPGFRRQRLAEMVAKFTAHRNDVEPAKATKPPAVVYIYRDWGGEERACSQLIKMSGILRIVSAETGIPAMHIVANRRFKSFVEARQAFCWLAKNKTIKSLPEIGRFIKRDHTTVLHAVRAAEQRMQKDPRYADLLDRCEQSIDAILAANSQEAA